MSLLAGCLWAYAGLLAVLQAAAFFASRRHFRLDSGPRKPLQTPFTVIKPLRGADAGMLDNFRALLSADGERRLQFIFAMESAEDPAHPAAYAMVREFPEHDVLLVETGPSGRRTGKMHNMIEALKSAKHAHVVFSDADVFTTREVLEETSAAFASGAEAVFAAPYHLPSRGAAALWYQIAFNHFFTPAAALSYRLGFFRCFAGAWMGYSRAALEDIGGLEPLARKIADDYSLGSRVVAAGRRPVLLRSWVAVDEEGKTLVEAFSHLSKWYVMGWWTLPWLYLLFPLAVPGFIAGMALAAGGPSALGIAFLAVLPLWRTAIGWAQDRWVYRNPMPWPGYLLLGLSDIGMMLLWVSGFRRRLAWRGRVYRAASHGEAELVRGEQR